MRYLWGMNDTPTRILVVDDEATICQMLQLNLELEGYAVDTAASGEEVLRMGPAVAQYQLILLDVMMDQVDGFQLAEHLRREPSTAAIPIIFCTARCEPDDEIHGLEIGGEDYITKPFSMRTLVARVRKVLSRTPLTAPVITSPDNTGISMDPVTRLVRVDGRAVALTPNEWGLLALLMAHPGCVFSRAEMLEAVRGRGVVVVDRTIDVNILHLRRKLAPYGERCILTRPGWGYVFNSL